MKNIKYILSILIIGIMLSFASYAYGLSGTLSASSYNVGVGENFTITITGNNTEGVAGLYIYRDFNRNSKGMIAQFVRGQLTDSVNHYENMAGVYRYCGFVERFFNNGVETSPNCIEVNVGSFNNNQTNPTNLNISCYVSPSNPRVGDRVSFISSVSGGTGVYSYSWSGDCVGNSSNCVRNFYSTGNYNSLLRVNSGNESRTVNCSVNVLSNNYNTGITRGNISVNSSSVYTGDTITIKVRGEDQNGLISLGAYYNGNWNTKNVSGTVREETWNITENTPGTYRYCGIVKGESQNENIRTEPYCLDVVVLSRNTNPISECSYVGETSCSASGLRSRCVNQNGTLKWVYESCTGNTSYGYGACNSDQKPSWSCKSGACIYTCIYDSNKNQTNNVVSDIKIENKNLPISVSLLARKKSDEPWKQELNVKKGDRIEFLAVIKSNDKDGVKDTKLIISPEKNLNFIDYSQTIDIGDLDSQRTETIIFYADVNSEETTDFEAIVKAQASGFEDVSKVKLIRDTSNAGLASVGIGFSGLFGSWWFWLILILLLFLFFYIFRKKKQ